MIREFKKEIISILKDIPCPVGFNTVPDESVYPHVTLDLPSSTYQEGLDLFMLDADVWDKGLSTKSVDEIAELVRDKLNRVRICIEELHAVIYYQSMGNVGSEDPSLKRKVLTFQVQIRRIK